MNYVLTLGLSAILDLADAATHRSPRVFVIASHMGWTTWKRPFGEASRSRFLKEAVSRVCKDKVAQQSQQVDSTQQPHDKQRDRTRSSILAEELSQVKLDTDFTNVPFSAERPMSVCSGKLESVDLADGNAQSGIPQTGQSVGPEAVESGSNPALPVKSVERVALVDLVSKGWTPNDAREALKAIDANGKQLDHDDAVEKASAWLTEQGESSNASCQSTYPG